MNNKIFPKVFMWMSIGLLVTFLTGIYTSTNVDALEVIFNKSGYWILLIIELGLAIFLSARIHKMSPTTAKVCYLLYTFFTGLTFSSIFIVYKIESIMLIFLVTAILFLIFAIIGKTTKVDLTKISTILLMALLGIIICTIINIFLQNSTFDMILSGISVLIFMGFIAYDIQKIKRLEGWINQDNLAVIGAFELYLDFINIFLDLLSLFGDSKD
ncbi:MAG TPA: Bax inhibitor-1/YccA family protein [Candidatus Scybalousia intestinigallinarum]|nr:Bax inhibitor-1/YccA family protein [Candidatus Scybalousia intestinigallinarum]